MHHDQCSCGHDHDHDHGDGDGHYDPSSISQPLQDLALLALGHAMSSIEEGGPLVPFYITESDGKRALFRCVATRNEDEMDLEASVAAARDQIRQTSPRPQLAVLAMDAFINDEDQGRTDAIVVEAYNQGDETGWVFVLPYATNEGESSPTPIDDPAVVAVCDPLF